MRSSKARPRRQGPSLRVQSNGQYTIRVKRKDYYLGTHLEEALRQRFEILALAANGALPAAKRKGPVAAGVLTVARLVDVYIDAFSKNPHKPRYRDDAGTPAGHAKNVADGLQILKDRRGDVPAAEFPPEPVFATGPNEIGGPVQPLRLSISKTASILTRFVQRSESPCDAPSLACPPCSWPHPASWVSAD